MGSAVARPVMVRRDGCRVWLDGVPAFVADQVSTPIACLSVAMRSLGADCTYPWLMGVSGHAFRFQLSKGFRPEADGWCGSSPHAACGHNTYRHAVEALPYRVVPLPCHAQPADTVAAARARVTASIDAGIPAVAASEEDTLIVGYVCNGDALLRRGPFDAPSQAPQEWTDAPWGFSVLDPRPAAPDRSELVRESLSRAAEIAWLTETGAESGRPGSGYDAGLPALDRWASELRADAAFGALDAEALRRVQQFNAWIFHSLCDARQAAAAYLPVAAPLAPEASRPHVEQAGMLYGEVARALTATCPATVAPYPGMMAPGETWSQALRHQQANTLRRAIAYEEPAMEALVLAAEVAG